MKKADLTKRLAKETRLSRAAAADQLDRVVHELVTRLRKGQKANLPGLGSFDPLHDAEFGFEVSPKKPRKK
jgi:nucleoid DNA-binding protein